ncbi:MAG TPA: sugar ABC transporter permease [Trueperaceae bacterium]|nr:sugar ABC transporter permease [Trueperaceae bacterium]
MARRRERWFYLLITPWLIGLVVFQGGPLVAVVAMSFADWPLPQPPRFVGLDNLSRLVSDPLFVRSLVNTAYYALGLVPLGLALGFALAVLLHRPRPGVRLFRTIVFLPAVLSGVAMALVWGWIFNPRFGLANQLLGELGIRGPGWLHSEAWAMPTLILMGLWGVGVNMVVYLAALEAVPAELYDAARLDGAGRWAQWRHVTWPLVSPVTFYLAVVNLIGAFQVFTPSYVLTGGGPNNATLTLPLYLYQNAFSYGRIGYAAALAVALLACVGLLTLAQFRLFERRVFYLGRA